MQGGLGLAFGPGLLVRIQFVLVIGSGFGPVGVQDGFGFRVYS